MRLLFTYVGLFLENGEWRMVIEWSGGWWKESPRERGREGGREGGRRMNDGGGRVGVGD